ncbi:MAG: type I-D CRISPR-associated protein Cas7/Csc2 [Thermoplasmata archaeon]
MGKIIEKIKEMGFLPEINKLDLKKNHGVFLKIGIVSETTGFFINRNNEPTELTSENFFNEERLVVPAPKWRGPERTYLLSELRKVEKIIPQEYSRNMVKEKKHLKNPASLIFGDSSTGGGNEAAGIAARTFYDWSYSYESLSKISVRYLHNSLSDDNTILHDENGVLSNAIYNTPYVKPGVKLIRYVSMENVSMEMLILQLIAIIGTTRYGARTSILGDNISNKIIGIGFSKREAPISSYSTMVKAWEANSYEPEKLILEDMKKSYSDKLISGNEIDELIDEVIKIRKDKDKLTEIGTIINTKIDNDWKDF